ncbi:MAG: hypothetical protein IPL61_16790 [Myxococcales bacterium]|nr:hypothetical protein [Myxococcales bacterium]
MARRPHPDEDVPRLPRGRGLSFSMSEVVRILVVATGLAALLILQKPCADSVSKFVTSFSPVDAGAGAADAGAAAIPTGVRLRTDMTPAEIEAAIRAARGEALDAGAVAPELAPPDAR